MFRSCADHAAARLTASAPPPQQQQQREDEDDTECPATASELCTARAPCRTSRYNVQLFAALSMNLDAPAAEQQAVAVEGVRTASTQRSVSWPRDVTRADIRSASAVGARRRHIARRPPGARALLRCAPFVGGTTRAETGSIVLGMKKETRVAAAGRRVRSWPFAELRRRQHAMR
jgi:hypothetical protein